MKKKRKKFAFLLGTAVFLIVLYSIFINFLVSAALVPSFMRKLEAFERITQESYAALVQTSDIQGNQGSAAAAAEALLGTARRQRLTVRTRDGYTLVAAEFSQEESHDWALLLHGYTGWKEAMYPFAAWYYEQGYQVLAPDLRCQGESEGDFIGMGWTDCTDCMLWIDYILAQDPAARIVIHGQSMGAATALMMTGEEELPVNIRAVIADCAYTDAYTMFGEKIQEWFHLPAVFLVDSARVALLLRGGYDLRKASALEAVKKSDTPTLFIHGTEDRMIAPDMTEALYTAAGCPKKKLLIKGAGHAQAQDKAPGIYYGAIRRFLETYAQESS